jgi:hypothetical protein
MRRNTLLPALLGWATVSGYDADPLSHFYPDICPIFSTALTPGETSCLSLCWAVLDIFIAGARGLGLSELESREIVQHKTVRAYPDQAATKVA